jgi:hypothetical protein
METVHLVRGKRFYHVRDNCTVEGVADIVNRQRAEIWENNVGGWAGYMGE